MNNKLEHIIYLYKPYILKPEDENVHSRLLYLNENKQDNHNYNVVLYNPNNQFEAKGDFLFISNVKSELSRMKIDTLLITANPRNYVEEYDDHLILRLNVKRLIVLHEKFYFKIEFYEITSFTIEFEIWDGYHIYLKNIPKDTQIKTIKLISEYNNTVLKFDETESDIFTKRNKLYSISLNYKIDKFIFVSNNPEYQQYYLNFTNLQEFNKDNIFIITSYKDYK